MQHLRSVLLDEESVVLYMIKPLKRIGLKMRSTFIIYLFTLLFLLCCFPLLHAQEETLKPRVGIIPMINTEKDFQYDPICETIDDTVRLNIELLQRYLVVKTEKIDPYGEPEVLKKYAEEHRLDNLVFGKLSLGRRKEIILQMSVYDKTKDRITFTKEGEAVNIFEIFDTADLLVKDLVREFSNMHVGYGTVRVRNTGEEGNFSVYIDGQHGGDNRFEIPQVFNGKRLLEIRQNRMLGPETIYSREIWVYEDRISTASFAVPYLLEKERAELNRLEGIIRQYEDRKGEKDRVIASFNELLGLLADVSYCFRLEEERMRYRQMEVMYSLTLNRWDMEDNFFKPKQEVFDDLLVIFESAGEYLDPDAIRLKTTENANFFYNILGVHAAHDFSEGELKKGYERYETISSMAERVPITDYHLFEEEKKYIDGSVKNIIDRGTLGRLLAGLSIKKKLNRYFGFKLKASKELFQNFSNVSKKELIVLTNPSGMKVYTGEDYVGRSPIRIKRLKTDQLHVRAEDPWFHGESDVVFLNQERNFLFLRAVPTERIILNPAESTGQKSFLLSWEDMPDSESYLVQVARSDEDFRKPLFEKEDIKKSRYSFKEKLDEGVNYHFRVQAVNENKIRSVWSYGEELQNRIQWSYATGGKVWSAPVVNNEGTVFVGSEDRCLYALSPEGTTLWVFMTGGAISSAPVLGPEGSVYFGSHDRSIYALNPEGELRWTFVTGSIIQASPVLGPDGTLYAVSTDGCLYALNGDGSLKWVFQTGGRILSSPAISGENEVCVGSEDHTLYVLSSEGTLRWLFQSGGPVVTTPVVDSEGNVYFGSDDHLLYALDVEGAVRWLFQTGGKVRTNPILDREGSIYFGSEDHCVYALHHDGSTKWVFGTESEIQASLYLDSDGSIYFSDRDKKLYALLPDGGLKWKYTLLKHTASSLTQSSTGMILLGSRDKQMYALSP